jgi:uncharacterized protein (DUF433 family)
VNDDELIERHIMLDPWVPGKGNARTKNGWVHVWALVNYWRLGGEDVKRAAKDYDLPAEVIEAALSYYRRYPMHIDVAIDDNSAQAS